MRDLGSLSVTERVGTKASVEGLAQKPEASDGELIYKGTFLTFRGEEDHQLRTHNTSVLISPTRGHLRRDQAPKVANPGEKSEDAANRPGGNLAITAANPSAETKPPGFITILKGIAPCLRSGVVTVMNGMKKMKARMTRWRTGKARKLWAISSSQGHPRRGQAPKVANPGGKSEDAKNGPDEGFTTTAVNSSAGTAPLKGRCTKGAECLPTTCGVGSAPHLIGGQTSIIPVTSRVGAEAGVEGPAQKPEASDIANERYIEPRPVILTANERYIEHCSTTLIANGKESSLRPPFESPSSIPLEESTSRVSQGSEITTTRRFASPEPSMQYQAPKACRGEKADLIDDPRASTVPFDLTSEVQGGQPREKVPKKGDQQEGEDRCSDWDNYGRRSGDESSQKDQAPKVASQGEKVGLVTNEPIGKTAINSEEIGRSGQDPGTVSGQEPDFEGIEVFLKE